MFSLSHCAPAKPRCSKPLPVTQSTMIGLGSVRFLLVRLWGPSTLLQSLIRLCRSIATGVTVPVPRRESLSQRRPNSYRLQTSGQTQEEQRAARSSLAQPAPALRRPVSSYRVASPEPVDRITCWSCFRSWHASAAPNCRALLYTEQTLGACSPSYAGNAKRRPTEQLICSNRRYAFGG